MRNAPAITDPSTTRPAPSAARTQALPRELPSSSPMLPSIRPAREATSSMASARSPGTWRARASEATCPAALTARLQGPGGEPFELESATRALEGLAHPELSHGRRLDGEGVQRSPQIVAGEPDHRRPG